MLDASIVIVVQIYLKTVQQHGVTVRFGAVFGSQITGQKQVGFHMGSAGMIQLTIDIPDGALSSLRQDPVNFARELRLAAAVKWYEMRRISQGRAAEIAGVSRSEFVAALGQFGVLPF